MTDPSTSGSKLNSRYQFHAVIGHGGTGEVSTAWDTQLERTVAIKRVNSTQLSAEALSATWQEAMRLAAIRHANIVAVYDIGVEDATPYIVMEYVQGETIEQKVERDGPLGEHEFCEFARQTLEGIIAAHHAGLVHRDLKPANIMLARQPSGSWQVKVLDFGIARFLSAPQASEDADSVTGSIHCIAPEQLNREPVDVRTDLYSIGCVFYYALTGRFPFDAPKMSDVIKAHLNGNAPSLTPLRPDLPWELSSWVMRLIQRQPSDRPASGQHALRTLWEVSAAVRQTTAIPVARPAAGILARATPQRKWAPIVAACAAGALVMALLVGLLSPSTQQSGTSTEPSVAPAPSAPSVALPEPKPPVALPRPAEPNPVVAQPSAPPKEETRAPVIAEARPASNQPIAPDPAPVIAKPPVEPVPDVVLRLHGSNTIGAKLAPMLAEEFMKREGAVRVEKKSIKPEESLVIAHFAQGAPRAVEIAAHGTKTAFDGLASQACDIGMASRAAKPDEVQLAHRSGVGDLLSVACEHVLGLDGLGICIHRENPVKVLTKRQVAEIFTGKVTDWSKVGGKPGPIHLHARDAKSGTFDTFKSLVLGTEELAATAKRYEDSAALSDAVAADPAAIGFAGLPYLRQTRAVAVSEEGTEPFIPTRFTVAAEDYVLSRRLFLYTPHAPQNGLTAKFVEFALSPEGQEIVHRAGFVKQTIDLQRPVIPSGAPTAYTDAVKGAERLSLNLRFRSGSTLLDNKGLRDLERLTALLGDPGYSRRGLMLLGFSDQQGNGSNNLKVSRERAQAIAKELEARGIKPSLVTGFGSALAVASNTEENGRQRNRRVEVWLRAASAKPVAAQ